MQRAFKTRVYANNAQSALLRQCCGASRFAYNACLAKWNDDYRQDEQVRHNFHSIKKWFNHWKVDNAAWTYGYSKWIYEAAIRDLSNGFNSFFKGRSKHPRFHKRGVKDSFRIDGSVVSISGNSVKLPKGLTLKMAEPFRFEGCCLKVYNVTVSSRAGYWFVSITCEMPDREGESQADPVGIDMGVKELAALSDGSFIPNPKWYRSRERRLKHVQRSLSRKQKGSSNYRKAKAKLAKYQYRTACMRSDYIHKATSRIAAEHGLAFAEDLNVAGMAKNRHLAKSVADAGMSMFVSQLEYKMHVEKVDRWYPSTKTCSNCGHMQDMPLSVRTYECPECGASIDRDLNAARNILHLGVANYSEVMPVEGVEVPDWVFDWVAEHSVKQESTSRPA